ncbi:MAG: VWA-like domain-containing protein [Thiovulaceae bacterium]|nr:VWA-like domain-containing protein [Sulfurimonadaceae bacterium]
MSLTDKISKAKAKLLVDYPFFGSLASRVDIIKNDDIEAFKSDESKLEYSSSFIDNASIEELEFVLANSAMHASLSHKNRKNNRSGWLWQMATDYAINDMLVESGLQRPYQAHYSERFEGLYAEEIYALLKDDILRDDEDLEYEADNADDIEKDDSKQNNETKKESSTEQILNDQLFEEFVLSEIQKEKDDSRFPEAIKRFFSLDAKGKIDWRDELRDAIDRYARDDFTLIPPNKKYLYMGFYLPSAISETFNLVVAIDSSGSIDDELLSEFLSELNYLMLSVPKYKIEVLICDDKIHSHNTFYTGDTLEVDVKGGAGTDFRPVFSFIDENLEDTNLLLYFSDMDGIFPKDEPNYEVKWICKKNENPPFGKTIIME